MKMKKAISLLLALCLAAALFAGCKGKTTQEASAPKNENLAEDGEAFVFPENETDFGTLRTPGSQESADTYKTFFLPAQDGTSQPYVGDTMPFFDDGTYYIYYLKEGGDSYNHSIYLATTTDFVTYTEKDEVVLEASRSGGQDGWTGTGSVVKVKDTYYFFYTGHAGSDTYEYKEKVLVAKGSTPTAFEKVADWDITPPGELGQKNDFRDPQAYYDAATDTITMTVTASQAIALAGGFTQVAKQNDITLIRNKEIRKLNLKKLYTSIENMERDETLRNGDIIFVQESIW